MIDISSKLKFEIYENLSSEQKLVRESFEKQNFDIDGISDSETHGEIKEWYWKEPSHYIFGYLDNNLAAIAKLDIRTVDFNNKKITIAGLGGLAVAKNLRSQGIGGAIIRKRMDIAKEHNADIAFLNTDIKKLGGLFSKYGFVPLNKNYSFIDKSGKLQQDDSGMILPVNSQGIFEQVLNDKEIFFIGESNI